MSARCAAVVCQASGMPEPLVIRMDDLRAALSRALVAAEKRLGADVALADNHYWHLPVDEAFDMTREPASLTVSQLSDDLENLREAGDNRTAVDLRSLNSAAARDVWEQVERCAAMARAS